MVYPVEAFRTGNGLFVKGKYSAAIIVVFKILLDLILIVVYSKSDNFRLFMGLFLCGSIIKILKHERRYNSEAKQVLKFKSPNQMVSDYFNV